ncbi:MULTISPECIES: hypothetical protein [unclassified Cyanobium]|uniref:hypothetical protein n=1 Tax=unclassified Cyanobium TaxID=2627006 RepID=UPI0020CD693D|nr:MULTISPECIES: hypothetical protein [unclassified Cyanobium]
MPKPQSAQKLRKRTIKRRYRLFTLAEASHPLYTISGTEILGVVLLILIVAYLV